MKVYGYCRISTAKQSMERQIRNIKEVYPEAIIIQEVYTGAKFQGRKELDKLLGVLVSGDTFVCDSVSRMSRNAEEGFALYQQLFGRGIRLVFLKEAHINSDVYREAMENQISMTGSKADIILEAVNSYLLALAENQILIAFSQAAKELEDIHQRTKEGIETARLNGKQIGGVRGKKLTTKKGRQVCEQILKYSKDFGVGNLKDVDCIKIIGVTKTTYYKYKRKLREGLNVETKL